MTFDPQAALLAADDRLRLVAAPPDEDNVEEIEADDAALVFAGTDLPAPFVLALVEHSASEDEIGPRRAAILRMFWFAWELRGQSVPAVSENRQGWRARLAAVERLLNLSYYDPGDDEIVEVKRHDLHRYKFALDEVRSMLDETP